MCYSVGSFDGITYKKFVVPLLEKIFNKRPDEEVGVSGRGL